MIVLSWNICELGNEQTQAVLENLCTNHKPDWVALYEPKILKEHLPRNFLRKINLVFLANNDRPNSRLNIWILCKPELQASSLLIGSSNQFMAICHSGTSLIFVHTSNNYNGRRTLWISLLNIGDPNVCILGDFNVVLGAHECSSGHLTHVTPSEEFKNFISQCNLFDIEGAGNKFTWATRRNGGFIAARLDRGLASQFFLDLWDEVELLILPMQCSDHNPLHLPAVVNAPTSPQPFRFQDIWTLHENFFSTVKDCWLTPLPATNPTIHLITKLKRL